MEVQRPELIEFRGVCMSHYFTDNFDNVEKFQARPDDILIATYPKAVMEVKRPELTEFRGVCMSHYFTDNFDNVEKFQARPDDILIVTYPKAVMEVKRPELTEFRGVCMSHYFTDNFDNVEKFQARPDDILIVTYPKAGTTWISHILELIYFGKSPEVLPSLPIYECVPFLELSAPGLATGVELAEKMSSRPRLIKTHLPLQLVPPSFWEQNCRVIYVARNPKDNVVSFFHFDRMNFVDPEPGDWNSYLERFCQGKMVFGSWYDHVTGWWERRQTHPQLLYLFYEDMKEDLPRELDRLCDFLGVALGEAERDRVLRATGFEAMKNNRLTNYSTFDMMKHDISPFMRKGMVGDWKNHFTVAQSEAFDEDYRRKMKDSTLSFRMEL
ncbi:cytosolic sulfotransferase 1-like isoform X4 [Lepisosteus oculatus]|uniref:cytosolic sulfotransferase 1-like isoform X4 n=1 Tax=Lepisosteus oculatus TaxID=7918 RepID=UPI003721DEF2